MNLNFGERKQWLANYGYCGEMSIIAAGLYFGQYISQYDARAIAAPGVDQTSINSQLLLGVNATAAAGRMKLRSITWNNNGSQNAFFTWIKDRLRQGSPVLVGFLMGLGDSDYDHIVPAFGFKTTTNLSNPGVLDSDILTFDDLGVQSRNQGLRAMSLATLKQKNPLYYVGPRTWGLAITGVEDTGGETLRVRLTTSVNYENPEIRGNTRPAPMALQLNGVVSGLSVGQNYVLYRYNSFASVPTSRFNANAAQASAIMPFQATSPEFRFVENIQSNQMVIYRAVRADAP